MRWVVQYLNLTNKINTFLCSIFPLCNSNKYIVLRPINMNINNRKCECHWELWQLEMGKIEKPMRVKGKQWIWYMSLSVIMYRHTHIRNIHGMQNATFYTEFGWIPMADRIDWLPAATQHISEKLVKGNNIAIWAYARTDEESWVLDLRGGCL